MKRMIIAAALLIVAAGCSKLNDTDTVENTDVKIEFTIAEKPGFGAQTKALKTSWAVGDKIAIALKPSSAENVLYEAKAVGKTDHIYSSSAIILELTESGWEAESKITPPEGNGTYYAIHHRGTISATVTNNPASQFNLTGYQGGELMSFTGTYNYDNKGITLGAITMALDTRLMQISVADELNGGNLFLSQGYDKEYDLTCEIPEPEKTVKMSIYQDWITGDSPTTPLKGYIALCNGRVSLDFSKASLFVYSSSADAIGATPVINIYDEYDFDYSFWFANTAKVMFPPTSYTFFINRTAAAEADYNIHTDEDEVYKSITKSDSRTLKQGIAVKLPTYEWTPR